MPAIASANTPTPLNNFSRMDNNLYRCMVTRVCYVDDPMNVTTNAVNPQVLYELVVLGGFKEGQQITNARLASWLGGQYNYAERILRAASTPLNEMPLEEQDGDIVFVQFIQGDRLAPIIVGLGTQQLDGDGTGARIADGMVWVEQFNGVETRIDKDGNYSVIRKGGEETDGVFVPNETEADFTGQFNLTDEQLILKNDASTITLDKSSNTIVISNESGDGITINANSGAINIVNSGGIEINLTSSGLTIAGGSAATITADQISLNAGMVNVGEGASFKATIFENLKSAFESHVHQVPQATAGILPSQKPLQPLLPDVGSNSVRVKD